MAPARSATGAGLQLLVIGALVVVISTDAAPAAVRINCNATLAPGSTLRLTDKRDLSGKMPCSDNCTNDPYPCAIVGPDPSGPPATIMVPENDCALLAQGEAVLSGHLRFVVGHKNRQFDCCRDGEGHGSVLCSWKNLTIARGAVINVVTTDDTVVVNPGVFWTGNWIHVHGTVNASLKAGQLTGINGVISSSGVRVSAAGAVIASGFTGARGAAIQGGSFDTVLNGTVVCSDYTVGDSGGCIATDNNFTLGPTASVTASAGHNPSGGAGLVVSGTMMDIQGSIVAHDMNSSDAGAILTGTDVVMSGHARIVGTNIYSGAGGAIVSATNVTMRDNTRIEAQNTWGGDGGAIECTQLLMADDASLRCENGYADSCGACVSANIALGGRASIVARNMTGGALGGALCGGYPGQGLVVRGAVTIDVEGASAGLYGGALVGHSIDFGGGAFNVTLRDTEAACGGAIATLDAGNQWGEGFVAVDGSQGGTLFIENARERNATLGCRTILSHLDEVGRSGGKPVPIVSQPCTNCVAKPSAACACANQKAGAVLTECCSK